MRHIATAPLVALLTACQPAPQYTAPPATSDERPSQPGSSVGDDGTASLGTLDIQFLEDAPDFPGERDLAILLPLDEDPHVQASLRTTTGQALLSSDRLDAVAEAFDGTLADGAFFEENWYEDWRLVSMRVVPCGPVARSPALAPASVCWPAVRLVWQPVITQGVNLWGVIFDAYADDRAIHAIYPVQPRTTSGVRTSDAARRAVTDHLDAGGSVTGLAPEVLDAFDQSRDETTHFLLSQLLQLREPSLPAGSWSGIDVRPEFRETSTTRAFISRLEGFLSTFASPSDLREMTAFSLPAGRTPAGDDAWVFVQFLSDGVELFRNDLEVFSRTDGRLLLNYGIEQTVGQSTESDQVADALASPFTELRDTVVESSADIDEVADLVTDPTQVFVPNTTCATCHRLNPLRFDFHNLSHLEDREHTVSPRVVEDVAHEIGWVSRWARNAAPSEVDSAIDVSDLPPPTEDAGASSPSVTPETALEPNDSLADAALVSTPHASSLAITGSDVDYLAFDWTGGVVSVAIAFSHRRGDLDLSVLDAQGSVVGSSASVSDEEGVSLTLPAGRYIVKVEGYQGATGPYTLSID